MFVIQIPTVIDFLIFCLTELTTYKKRWVILLLFVLYSSSNAFQWTQLVIITNILENYYKVAAVAVSWTSLVFMVTYIPLIFPASWLLQTKVSLYVLVEAKP